MAGVEDLLGGLIGGASGGEGGQSGGLGGLLSGLLGGGGGGGGGGGAAGTAALVGALTPMVSKFLSGGGLNNLLSGFKEKGMEKEVDSWVSTNPNAAINGAQVQQVLSADQINDVATRLGVSPDEASSVLADIIPGVVNAVTPEGQVPSPDQLQAQFGG
jgi:uncharacterized protein YidB (DUF937 family)